MNKLDDLEKLQKLKEINAITNDEFEIEKRRILNNNEKDTKKLSKNKIKLNYIIVAIIVLIFLIIVYISVPKKVAVPNLIGMTVKEAQELMDNLGLNLRINSCGDATETIEEQFGATGKVEKDSNVYVSTKEFNDNNAKYINSNSKDISLEEFNKIQIGMSYQQVINIIGGEGNLLTEDAYTKSYSWNVAGNSGITTVIMGFSKNILISKMKY